MIRLFISGIVWHYSGAYKEILSLSRNFFIFLFHLFSIRDLSKTLFYPWQRLGERYRGGFHVGEWLSVFFVNILMRLVGFFVRLVVIIIGLLCVLVAVILAAAFIVVWTAIPVLMVFLFITSIRLFLS